MNNELAKKKHDAALSSGYDGCGIISLNALDGYAERLRERMEKVPASAGFYSTFERFGKLKEKYPWAKSVIVCSEWYGKYRFPSELRGRYAKAFLLAHITAPGSDTHKRFAGFDEKLSDMGIGFAGGDKGATGGKLPLRHAAAAAGLGIIRRNNFFYTDKGSWYNLSGWLIDAECELIHECTLAPCPEKCDLCRRACKTSALSAPYVVDPMGCVSFWTTFGKGKVPGRFTSDMFGEWMCGCDDCQDACPFNRHDWNIGEDFPGVPEIVPMLSPKSIASLDDETLERIVIPKTDGHIQPSECDTLRKNAARVLSSPGEAAGRP